MKSRISFNLRGTLIIFLISFLFAACGGGGGGGGSDDVSDGDTQVNYTGITSQAVLDETNAVHITTGAYQSGFAGDSLGDVRNLSETDGAAPDARADLFTVSALLKNVVSGIDSGNDEDVKSISISPDESIIPGNCGGTATYLVIPDILKGKFTGTMVFLNYCSDGTTVNGLTTFSGDFEFGTDEITEFRFSFDSLTVVSEYEAITINGTIAFAINDTTLTVTMTMAVKDNITGKVYRVKDYILTLTDGDGISTYSMSGTYYDPDHGYVTLATTTPFAVHDFNLYPHTGVLVVTGYSNVEDREATTKLTAVSATTYQVEADLDGDGSYEWSSGELLWSERE